MYFLKRKCNICAAKSKDYRFYVNDNGEKIKVCFKCVEYAERRAFVKW